MARYIDADALYKKLYPLDLADKRKYTINAKAVADAIANIPTADVVPKSEVEALKEMLDATIAGQETLQKALAKTKTKVAREIFEEIEHLIIRHSYDEGWREYIASGFCGELAELKKKYEVQNDG